MIMRFCSSEASDPTVGTSRTSFTSSPHDICFENMVDEDVVSYEIQSFSVPSSRCGTISLVSFSTQGILFIVL